ncbi:MAG: multidrug resistance efflux pump [Desulforhopalus sp.]|jgi:multidrug resistance efflux pump
MEVILLSIYFSFCWIIIKIFKIPINQWTITTVFLGAVVMLGGILMSMAYFHPSSKVARSYFISTDIVSNVRGKVIEIPVQANVPLEKGDVLFKIDSVPFQGVVDTLQAQLDFSRKRLEDSLKLVKLAGGAKFDVDMYEKEVKSLEGQLETAQFNLDSCVVRAPGKGYVTHLVIRPGQMAVPLPMAPVMTFVNSDTEVFVGGFSQEPMQNIKVGNDAEVIYPGIPGRVFKAKVARLLPALAEGEISAGRTMVSFTKQLPRGLVPVVLTFEEDMSEFYIPMGSDAVVALYSHRAHHIQILRKILLRVESWRNFIHFH